MNLSLKSSSRVVSTLNSTQGSSPHHQVTIQSFFSLPGSLEFTQTYRYISDLPAQRVRSYQTADVRLGWRRIHRFELSVVGQNLLQPHHFTPGGDPGPLSVIQRC